MTKKNEKVELKHPIWQRQEGESDTAYQSFLKFRDTPVDEQRSRKKVSEETGISYDSIQVYSSRFSWRERCLAYDRHVDGERIERFKRGVGEMRENHLKIAQLMRSKVEEGLKLMPAKKLTARDLKDWSLAAAKLEESAREGGLSNLVKNAQTVAEQDKQVKDALLREAREFLDEMRREQPDYPLEDLLSIVVEEFGVSREELGIKLDTLDATIIGETE